MELLIMIAVSVGEMEYARTVGRQIEIEALGLEIGAGTGEVILGEEVADAPVVGGKICDG